jgi:type I restriction enzyme S subunit
MKPGYKQTEIGVIPEEWAVKTLGSLTTLLTNGFVGTATTAYVESDDGVLYIQGYNVQENGFNFHGIKRVSKAFHVRNKKSCLQAGDLLTIQTGDIGVTTVVPPELAGANCHALIISRLRKRDSEPGYYCQYFNSERGRVAFKEIETGTTMKHLNGGDMKRLFLPFPPIEEQRAVATALSDVDGLLRGLDRLIAKKRDLKQAAMQQLLSGQQRLPSFGDGKPVFSNTEIGALPSDWSVVAVEQVTRSHKQGYYTKDRYVADGVRLVRITDLLNPRIDYDSMPMLHLRSVDHDLYRIRVGDFLFARSGAIGRYGIVHEDVDAIFGSYIIRFTFDSAKLTNEFFGYLYETQLVWKQLLSITQGSSNININASNIKSIKIPLPTLEEQTAIAEVLTEMDAELTALEQRREKTRALKQAMMQELLTGRTRLVSAGGNHA